MKRIWTEFLTVKTWQQATTKPSPRYIGSPTVVRKTFQLRVVALAWWDKGTGTLRVDLSCQELYDYSEPFDWSHLASHQVLTVVDSREKATRLVIAEIASYERRALERWATLDLDDSTRTDAQIVEREQAMDDEEVPF